MEVGIFKPNLAAIQTAFTGRLYSVDMFALYRAISGKYSTYPSIYVGLVGQSIHQDIVTFLGAFGPVARFHYVGDVYSVLYNQMVERDMQPVGQLSSFWPGWEAFTWLLQADAEELGEPLRFPAQTFTLPKLEIDRSQLGSDLPLYAIYRGDVDSMEILLSLLTQYMPETVLSIPLTMKDLEGIFTLYGEWAGERFQGVPASPGARVMSKVVLLADYRWYLLCGDLLAAADPAFTDLGFTSGIKYIADICRQEAERIKVSGGNT